MCCENDFFLFGYVLRGVFGGRGFASENGGDGRGSGSSGMLDEEEG